VRGTFSWMEEAQRSCESAELGKEQLCDYTFGIDPVALDQFHETQRDRIRWQAEMLVEF
jgi:hypothetical protein